ncbi:hypothetical protein [Actinomadura sp. K4S16]|uniref:hypothetical protein n=1 Tax=Actinomadura sp. K4S16 TaxID=1316147 RepID=UPI0011F078C1|nr:hypothetical protein [Actinomadura sp. K4S16]
MYDRTSRECSVNGLDPALRSALAGHMELEALGTLRGEEVCCQTLSVRRGRPGLLSRVLKSADPDREHRTTAVLTEHHLIVARSGEGGATTVLSAPLRGMGFDDISQTLSAHGEAGVSLRARWSGRPVAGSYFVALGDDQAGRAFRDALTKAVAKAKQR